MNDKKLRILVADDEPSIRKILHKLLDRHGYETLEASNGLEALKIFEEKKPDIVISDIRMPEMNGLDLLRAIKRISPEACVTIMTGFGTEEVAIEAIRSGACNYFKKPFQASELLYAIGALAELVMHRKREVVDFSTVSSETRICHVGNDVNQVYPLIQELTRTLQGFPYDVESIQIGLLEIITNAIEHGNLGITFQEKQEALKRGTFDELYRTKQASDPASGKIVEIGYEFSPSEVRYTITDSGGGFDWKNLPDSRDPKNIMETSGRGIIMTRLLMDEVSFNEAGNSVVMVKKARSG